MAEWMTDAFKKANGVSAPGAVSSTVVNPNRTVDPMSSTVVNPNRQRFAPKDGSRRFFDASQRRGTRNFQVSNYDPESSGGQRVLYNQYLGQLMRGMQGRGGGGGGGGGYGGGGGGGGSGPSAPDPAEYNAYASAMMKLINQGSPNPYADAGNPMAGRTFAHTASIDPAVNKEIGEARGATRDAVQGVSRADPYLALRNQAAAQVDPRLGALASRQGVGAEQSDLVAAEQVAAQGGADNWANLAATLGINHVAGQEGIVSGMRQQGDLSVANFEAERLGMQSAAANTQQRMDDEGAQYGAVMQQKQAEFEAAAAAEKQKAMMQLLAQGLPYGITDFSGVTG